MNETTNHKNINREEVKARLEALKTEINDSMHFGTFNSNVVMRHMNEQAIKLMDNEANLTDVAATMIMAVEMIEAINRKNEENARAIREILSRDNEATL